MFSINEKCLNKSENTYEPNIYYYKGLDKLENNCEKFDNILKSTGITNFYICGYKINNNELYPFLNFLFKNDHYNNILSFPSVKMEGSYQTIIDKIKILLYSIFLNIELDDKYEYNGYYYYENNIYLFFNFTNCKICINNIYKKSVIWSALVDEIINIKHICNIQFESDTSDFFTKNIDFVFLKDKNNKNYEIPSVVYVGREESKLNFTYIFGVQKQEHNSMFGHYYYFTNFTNAIKQSGCSNDNKGGIIKFALFTGLTKVILNNVKDSVDESFFKKYLINNLNNLFDNLTLRITDYDGKWANNYDSLYIGEIELDNGEKLSDVPIYVVKKYEQQISLSYHFIDPNKNCQIL
jgi:hypothetical protein